MREEINGSGNLAGGHKPVEVTSSEASRENMYLKSMQFFNTF
jgi:hypothetical protein